MSEDLFAKKSKSWDMNSKRVKNAKAIAEKVVKRIALKPEMRVMDFGAGTGLLSYFIAPYIDTIVAVDNSPSMLEMFREKSSEFKCKTEVLELDLNHHNICEKFDGIISSMTIHHIEALKPLFQKLYDMLEDGGFVAIADLDREDGTFHSDNSGVFHFGFERSVLEKIVEEVGFRDIKFELASTINKPHNDFTLFLMTAYR